jgi:YCII-related domain
MKEYVLVFSGAGKMPESDEEKQQAMSAWNSWFEGMGDKVKDQGNPFGSSKEVAADGSVSDSASSGLSGYTILKADSLDDAVEMAKQCPVLQGGSAIEVYEVMPVM